MTKRKGRKLEIVELAREVKNDLSIGGWAHAYQDPSYTWISVEDVERILGKYRNFPMRIDNASQQLQYTDKSSRIVSQLFAEFFQICENGDRFAVNNFDLLYKCTKKAFFKKSNLSVLSLDVTMNFLSKYHACLNYQLKQVHKLFQIYEDYVHSNNNFQTEVPKDTKDFLDFLSFTLKPIGLCWTSDWIATRIEYAIDHAKKNFCSEDANLFINRLENYSKSIDPKSDWKTYFDNGGLIPSAIRVRLRDHEAEDPCYYLWNSIEEDIYKKRPSSEDLKDESAAWTRNFLCKNGKPIVYHNLIDYFHYAKGNFHYA